MSERNLDFDHLPDRSGTGSIKWDHALYGRTDDDLPLWVADMDFRTSSYVEDALAQEARHNIYGYTYYQEEYWNALSGYLKKYHHYEPDPDSLIRMPGVVPALAMAVRAFTEPGEAVLIQEPVYMHFRSVIEDNGRVPISNDLVFHSGHYEIDFADFEQKIVENHIRLFLLCNPHNPGGRVWTEEELRRMGEICVRHDVLIASDDIHLDFVWSGEHHFLSELDHAFAERSILCTAPSKTFNLAGLQDANIFIADRKLYRRFRQTWKATGMGSLSQPAQVSMIAAYTHGDEWRNAMLSYVSANLDFAVRYIREEIPKLKTVKPEGTYLLWIDCRPYNPQEISRRSHVFLNNGADFGAPGAGFLRLNAACPRQVLKKALARLRNSMLTIDQV